MKATILLGAILSFSAVAGSRGQSDVPVVAPVYPLKVHPSNRYLIDSAGTPIFLNGDSAWSLEVNCTLADMDLYLANRRSKGVNLLLTELIEHDYSNQSPRWKNVNGDVPFSGTLPGGALDFTTPVENYWRHVDAMVRKAHEHHMILLITPAYCGFQHSDGWATQIIANGDARMRAYGRFVGQRYKDHPNIIWAAGGDYLANGPQDLRSAYQNLKAGIQEFDTNHLWTAHSYASEGNATNRGLALIDYAYLNLDLNNTYSYPPASAPLLAQVAYQRTPVMPFFRLEGDYENGFGSSVKDLRYQEYHSILGGAFGHIYGNWPVWYFGNGSDGRGTWQQNLDTPGARDLVHVGDLFRSRAFHLLVPDYAHTIVTANYGTLTGGNYVGCASTSDGNTIIIYKPSNTPVSVNLNTLAGEQANVWHYHPQTGAATLIETVASTGTHTYSGTTGSDYVLVIDSAAANFSAPGNAPLKFTVVDAATPSRVALAWTSRPGARYALEASENLAAWTAVDDSLISTNTLTSFTHGLTNWLGGVPRQLFYRVRERP